MPHRAGLAGSPVKAHFAEVQKRYERHRRNGVLPATYEVVFGHAWAPLPTTRPQDGSTVATFPLVRVYPPPGGGSAALVTPEPQPSSRRGVFVTGTDTGVGKTWTVVGLLTALRRRGQRVRGMKPVATGCRPTEQGLRSDDALMIQDHAGEDLPYEWVNPYAFEPPIAPAFAARQAGVRISIPRICAVERRLARAAELAVIEGIGGWRVPLGPRSCVSDLAARLGYPVVLVVGLRLGCINHALLSAEAIERDGAVLAGWMAMQIDRDYRTLRDTLDTVKARIPSPQLGFIPWMSRLDPEALASHLEAGLRYIL